ncbi:MAG: Shikimate 5-dehydrogenase alpha [Myxococcaceae bacterium]|nr:Shikimate 5-dehydrogenase alpha [Myxococcaceae bacterium]
MTATYGILGWPVEHSRSPAMHTAAFRARGLEATYAHFPVHPDDVADAVRGLKALGLRGANVTVPHKEAVIRYLDHVTPEARAIGAVNTIVRDVDRLIGHNTDAPGLARSLDDAGVDIAGARALVLGAGGAARASVVGLAGRGASRIAIAARRIEQAEQLVRDLQPSCGRTVLEATVLTREALADELHETTLLVQSTSATLASSPDAAGFAASLAIELLPAAAAVVDLVYRPRITAVLARAEERGLKVVDGLGMLLHQGALAFELWTHMPAPLDVMRAALELP